MTLHSEFYHKGSLNLKYGYCQINHVYDFLLICILNTGIYLSYIVYKHTHVLCSINYGLAKYIF